MAPPNWNSGLSQQPQLQQIISKLMEQDQVIQQLQKEAKERSRSNERHRKISTV